MVVNLRKHQTLLPFCGAGAFRIRSTQEDEPAQTIFVGSAYPRFLQYSSNATSIRLVSDRRSLSATFSAKARMSSSIRVVNGVFVMHVHCPCKLVLHVQATCCAHSAQAVRAEY
jgi:hypothetical protein